MAAADSEPGSRWAWEDGGGVVFDLDDGSPVTGPMASVPFHVRPDGEFPDLFEQSARHANRASLCWAMAQTRWYDRRLAADHLDRAARWLAEHGPFGDRGIGWSRDLEAFVAQFGGRAVARRDLGAIEVMVRAAMAMGTWTDRPGEAGWTGLVTAHQVGDLIAGPGQGAGLVEQAAALVGADAVRATAVHSARVAAALDRVLVHDATTQAAIFERPWDPHASARRFSQRLSSFGHAWDSHVDAVPWGEPTDGYLGWHVPGSLPRFESGPDDFVDQLNRFLLTGSTSHLNSVIACGLDRPRRG